MNIYEKNKFIVSNDKKKKLMKLKGLDELCAATSDLANQTGIEKTDLLIIHKLNLTSSHLKKNI